VSVPDAGVAAPEWTAEPPSAATAAPIVSTIKIQKRRISASRRDRNTHRKRD
jgi:hypothetical protein